MVNSSVVFVCMFDTFTLKVRFLGVDFGCLPISGDVFFKRPFWAQTSSLGVMRKLQLIGLLCFFFFCFQIVITFCIIRHYLV